MKKYMVKLIPILLCTALAASAIPMNVFSFVVDPKVQIYHTTGNSTSYSSLDSAINAAVDGDTITLAGEVASLDVTDGITVKKNITFKVGRSYSGNRKSVQYNGTSTPFFTVENGGVLTVSDSYIYGNQNTSLLRGGFALVKKGGTLIINGKTGSEVNIKSFSLKASSSKGGAIYCEQGGKVIINGVTFGSNFASSGSDVYAEQKTDVTIASGVTANASYGESVDINALNLVLNGEIGLVFHTAVPEKYRNGCFVLSSRASTVTYNIDECGKDAEGRYLAKYSLSSIELSEPVTLTVCDKDGGVICASTSSAEEYGNILLADKNTPENARRVVTALLNYGHFSQIECAANNGWTVGEDYAETKQYEELSVGNDAFDGCLLLNYGHDDSIGKIGIQPRFGYKTDLYINFYADEAPAVTVNGEEVSVSECALKNYNYRIELNGISALDLSKVFTVVFNDKFTMKLSVLGYCRLAVKSGSENTVNTVKALYEFYSATSNYNKKQVSPDEDSSAAA